MSSLLFSRSPAFVSIGDGLAVAARFWRSSWERWVLPVVAIALVNGLAGWVFGATALDRDTLQGLLVPGPDGPGIDPSSLPTLMAGPLAIGLVTIVAEWFLVANAIAGLRGREVTLGWVLTSGLRAFAADMVVASGLVMIMLTALSIGMAGLIAVLLLLPALVYVGIRLQFWTLAIFDGAGVASGLRASWAITRGGVLRVFGWGLAMAGLGLIVSVLTWVLGLALAGAPPVADVLGAAAESVLQAFTAIVLAVLYESQRLRNLPRVVEPEPYRSPLDPPAPPPPYRPSGGPRQ